MPDYVATIRFMDTLTPMKMEFSADDALLAIDKMCVIACVDDVSHLEEFDLLQVVGKDAYSTVASRMSKEDRAKIIRQRLLPTTVPIVSPAVETERIYVPYQLVWAD